jgi:SAM-dependent methyltransferase
MVETAPKLLGDRPQPAVIDLGCGNGDFLHGFGKALGGQPLLTGIDISSDLLDAGRRRFPDIEFIKGDLRQAPSLCRGRRFDAVCLLGTHSIFDDVESWLDPVVALAAPHGIGFVLGLFNPHDFDTVTRWRRSPTLEWQSGGYNCWSQLSVSRRLRELDCGFEFTEILFDTSFIDSLPSDYPMTFRRVKLEDGKTRVANGLQLLCNYYLLTVQPRANSGQLSAGARHKARLFRSAINLASSMRRILRSRRLLPKKKD